MKATKSQLRAAIDAFLYTHRDLTGGTRDEVRNQAPRGFERLSTLAAEVATLAANPNKSAAADSHLMEYAQTIIPGRLAKYEKTFLTPSNVIAFA